MSSFHSTEGFFISCVYVSNDPFLTWYSKGGRSNYCTLIPSNYLKPSDNSKVLVLQLPPKPQTLQDYTGKLERKRFQTATKSSILADTPKPATTLCTSTQKSQRMPQVNDNYILSSVFTNLCYFDTMVDCWSTRYGNIKKASRSAMYVRKKGGCDLLSRKERMLNEIDSGRATCFECFMRIQTEYKNLNICLMAVQSVWTGRNFNDKVQ